MSYVDPSVAGTPAPGGQIKSAWGVDVQQDIEYFAKNLATLNVAAFGAVGDGATNNTVAIQNTINAASAAGGGVVYIPAGTFKVIPATIGTFGGQVNLTCALTMASNVHIRCSPLAKLIKPAYVSGNAAFIGVADNVNNWSIEDVTFDGQYTGVEAADYGVLVGGASDWSITGCTFKNMGSGGVQVWATASPLATRWRINNNTFTNNYHLVGIVNVAKFEIIGNFGYDTQTTGGEAIISAFGVSYGRISGNRILNWGAISINYNSTPSMVGVEISDNWIQGADTVGIQSMLAVNAAIDCTINNNVLDCSLITLTANSWGLSVNIATDCLFDGNILIGSSAQTQAQLLATGTLTRCTFTNNTITGASSADASGSVNISAASTGIKFINNTCDNELVMFNCSQSFVANNRIVLTRAGQYAVIVGANTVVAGNYIDATTGGTACNAVRLNGNNCVCTGNRVTSANNNSAFGAILANSASGCIITGNIVTLVNTSQKAFLENSPPGANLWANNTIIATTPVVDVTGAGSVVRGNIGYNPVGVVTVTVPATTVAVAAAVYDRTFYVTTVAGTTTCSMAIQSGPTVTFVGAVAQVVAVKVPAGKTVTPTFTGTAPTWVVEGE